MGMKLIETTINNSSAWLEHNVLAGGWPEYVEELIRIITSGGDNQKANVVVKDDRHRYDITYNDGCVGVIKIFEVPDDAKYAILHWHGFDGVDISVNWTNTSYKETFKEMTAEYTNFVDSFDVPCGKYCNDHAVVIDTGTEWYGWKIVCLEKGE